MKDQRSLIAVGYQPIFILMGHIIGNQRVFTICAAIVGAISLIISWTSGADGLPQYAVKDGRNCVACHEDPKLWIDPVGLKNKKCTLACQSCHVDPSGGGMRTQYGMWYGKHILPWSRDTTFVVENRFEKSPDRAVAVGGDLRYQYYETPDVSSFMAMQQDVYLNVTPLTWLELYMHGGSWLFDANNFKVRNSFAMIDDLPYNSYIKAGKFVPAYGLRIEDHTAYIRRDLGFNVSSQENGIQFGTSYYHFLDVGIFNGTGATGLGGDGFDDNRDKGFYATGGWKDLSWQLGSSYYTNNRVTLKDEIYGFFAAYNWRRFTLMAEGDRKIRIIRSNRRQTITDAFYGSCDINLRRGVNGKVEFDYFDPDNRVPFDTKYRIGIGLDITPTVYTKIFAQYRFNREPREFENNEVVVQARLWF